jgi:hypothetical protein
MEKHISLIDGIKCNIEIAKQSGEMYSVKGWVFSNKEILDEIQIVSKNHLQVQQLSSRPDVSTFYKTPSSELSGFNIQISTSDIKDTIQLQVKQNNEWQDFYIIKDIQLIPTINSNGFKKKKSEFLVVDDFYGNPDAVRDFALSLEYREQKNYFKGQRTDNSYFVDGTKEMFESLLNRKITNWDHQMSGRFQYCTAAEPVVYHHDVQSFAAVVYLTPEAPPESGTAFFRRKNTKQYRNLTDEEATPLNKTQKELLFDTYLENAVYDRTRWELIDLIGNRYNRLVIWDAQLFHAANTYFGGNINDSRLFHIFFFDAE